MSTYFGLDTKLRGRCRESRKLANNTYARRRHSGKIAIQLHATDILTFHSDGQIDLNTGGWDTVTTRSRMNDFIPRPWRVGGNRGSTLLYKMEPQAWTPVAVIDRRLTIEQDGAVTGGQDFDALFDEIRRE